MKHTSLTVSETILIIHNAKLTHTAYQNLCSFLHSENFT